jgi:transposase
MYIRQTRTNNTLTGEGYFTFRLVRGERIAGKVRQITLLNLGRDFCVKREDWPLLCTRLEQLLQPQATLLALECPAPIEQVAQRLFARLVAKAPVTDTPPVCPTPAVPAPAPDFQEVDIDSLQQSQPRTVGVEQLGLQALRQLGLIDKFAELGINGVMRASLVGTLIGRMAQPASERATLQWLQNESGLGELMDVDFCTLSLNRMYRASDVLIKHRSVIESHLFSTLKTLFSLAETVTLYDLTNTYFEGQASANDKAKHGRSKEKRSDCPLLTLGLVLDGSGFVRRSQTFAGNVSEGQTLQTMLTGLDAPPGALVVMDAGIATEANLAWLAETGYRYLVVRRGGTRQFDESLSVGIENASGETLQLQKTYSEDRREVLLYCHSPGREAKETAMSGKFAKTFEAGLQKIADGLTQPRAEKRIDRLHERIGRLKAKSRGAGQHYTISLTADETGERATALTWTRTPVSGTMATHPGVYCLRSNEVNWDEERLWRTYAMLTDLEAVFRSLKSELGMRPVFHSKEERCEGHLFITVLAYQCVQVLRTQLRQAGLHESWSSVRKAVRSQCRVTASVRRKDGRTIHVRKSTVAEPAAMKIYQAVGAHPAPGGTRKMIQ